MRTPTRPSPISLPNTNVIGIIALVAAVLIFGASNAVVRKLSDLGGQALVDGHNPISFCNVLFVGNLCAFGLIMLIYRRDLRPAVFHRLSGQHWFAMTAVALLGTALAPALVFSALAVTSVNNVVLISRIEPPLILALSVILLDERVNAWVVGGAALSFLGVLLTVLLQMRPAGESAAMLGNGEFWTAMAAIALALSTIISKVSLRQVPIGVFGMYRMGVGTAVFFVLAIILFGPRHFADVGSPVLWRWILLYSAGIVVAGQLLWYYGLRHSTAREVSLASTLNPVAGLLAAFVVLGDAPTFAQILGGATILAGMAMNHYGLRQLHLIDVEMPMDGKVLDDSLGFKGL